MTISVACAQLRHDYCLHPILDDQVCRCPCHVQKLEHIQPTISQSTIEQLQIARARAWKNRQNPETSLEPCPNQNPTRITSGPFV